MIDRLVRLLGSDASVVRILRHHLARAAEGAAELAVERRGGGLAPRHLRLFFVVVLIDMSLALAVVPIVVHPPVLAARFIAGCAALVALGVGLLRVFSVVLDEADHVAIGWWPISRRDCLLAQLMLLGRDLMGSCALLVALPLIPYTIVAPHPFLDGPGLALGLALQTLAILLAVVSGTLMLQRRLGRQSARRTGRTLTVLAVMGFYIASFISRGHPGGSSWMDGALSAWLPLDWFAAWGVLGGSSTAPFVAGMGLALVVLLGMTVPIFQSARDRGGLLEPMGPTPRRSWMIDLLGGVLAVFTRRREGRILRRLVIAHVREDWRLGVLRYLYAATLGLCVVILATPAHDLAGFVFVLPDQHLPIRGIVVWLSLALASPIVGLLFQQHSEFSDAGWLIATGDLDRRRLAAAQRGVARAVTLAPALLTMFVLWSRAGAPFTLTISDLLLVAGLFELMLRIVQRWMLALPFCRSWYAAASSTLLIIGALNLPLITVVSLWTLGVYDKWLWARVGTWVMVAVGIIWSGASFERLIREEAPARPALS
ncbi:MAG: hypothetical protein ACE5IK_07085 [Acidobacteriota bacterium]